MDGKLLLVPILAVLLSMPEAAEARIYEYVDSNGRKVFVDRLSKIPPQYRSQMKTREEQRKAPKVNEKPKDFKLGSQLDLDELDDLREEIQAALKKWTTPFQFHANRIVVPVEVSYGAKTVQLSLVMDTGASSTVVHKSAIASLNAQLRKGANARVADGSVVKTKTINFDLVELGPFKAKSVTSSVLDYQGQQSPTDGLLGMDFLYQVRFEIDRANQVIIWEPERYKELQRKLKELDQLEQKLSAPGPN